MYRYFLILITATVLFSCDDESNPSDPVEKIELNGLEFRIAEIEANYFQLQYEYKKYGSNPYTGYYSSEGSDTMQWNISKSFQNDENMPSMIDSNKLLIIKEYSDAKTSSSDYIVAVFNDKTEEINSLVISSYYSFADNHASYSSSNDKEDKIILENIKYSVDEEGQIIIELSEDELDNSIKDFVWSRGASSSSFKENSSSADYRDALGFPLRTDSAFFRIKFIR